MTHLKTLEYDRTFYNRIPVIASILPDNCFKEVYDHCKYYLYCFMVG